mgnify:CR=1 FL=1
MYECMFVCMNVCVHMCVYVCMYVYVLLCVCCVCVCLCFFNVLIVVRFPVCAHDLLRCCAYLRTCVCFEGGAGGSAANSQALQRKNPMFQMVCMGVLGHSQSRGDGGWRVVLLCCRYGLSLAICWIPACTIMGKHRHMLHMRSGDISGFQTALCWCMGTLAHLGRAPIVMSTREVVDSFPP